jgi:putative FmdB family regulatory protein
MPFYTFKCPKCNTQRDELVRMGTESTTCAECGTSTEKQPSFKAVALGLPNGFHTMKNGRDK